MGKQTLFEIGGDMQALDDLLNEEGIDWDSPEVQEIICGLAEENEENFNNKIDNYAALLSEWQYRANIRKSEAKRMNELARVEENKIKNLKSHLKNQLEFMGRNKVETARYKVTVAKNGGKLPLSVTDDWEYLPTDCLKTEVKPDADVIRAKIEAGEKVFGCSLGERGTSLRIK